MSKATSHVQRVERKKYLQTQIAIEQNLPGAIVEVLERKSSVQDYKALRGPLTDVVRTIAPDLTYEIKINGFAKAMDEYLPGALVKELGKTISAGPSLRGSLARAIKDVGPKVLEMTPPKSFTI